MIEFALAPGAQLLPMSPFGCCGINRCLGLTCMLLPDP